MREPIIFSCDVLEDGNRSRQALPLDPVSPVPVFQIDSSIVKDAHGGRVQVAQLDINRPDGKTARFWVSVQFNNQSRPQIVVSTNSKDNTMSKSLTGRWWENLYRRINQWIIRLPGGHVVVGFDEGHMIVARSDVLLHARKFSSEYAAQQFIDDHADIGYGLVSSDCTIANIG